MVSDLLAAVGAQLAREVRVEGGLVFDRHHDPMPSSIIIQNIFCLIPR